MGQELDAWMERNSEKKTRKPEEAREVLAHLEKILRLEIEPIFRN